MPWFESAFSAVDATVKGYAEIFRRLNSACSIGEMWRDE